MHSPKKHYTKDQRTSFCLYFQYFLLSHLFNCLITVYTFKYFYYLLSSSSLQLCDCVSQVPQQMPPIPKIENGHITPTNCNQAAIIKSKGFVISITARKNCKMNRTSLSRDNLDILDVSDGRRHRPLEDTWELQQRIRECIISMREELINVIYL